MSLSGLAVANTLRKRNTELAHTIVALHWKKYPSLPEKNWGTNGRQKCEEDAVYHLRYLAAAVQMSSTLIFEAYMGWAKVLLARYDIPEAVLVDFMETIIDVISDHFPPTEASYINQCILRGIEGLNAHPVHPESFLNEKISIPSLANVYLQTLLQGDRTAAVRLAIEAIDSGLSLQDFYIKILQPVQYEIGRLWQIGQINVAQEHLSTAITQFVMAQLYSHVFEVRERPRHLVATSVGDEGHEVGMRMIVDLCEMDGWRTYYLGANTPHGSVTESAQAFDAQLLCISATMGYHLPQVVDLIAQVRQADQGRRIRILVGGMAFNVDEQLWQKVGADGYAPNAEQAVKVANQLVSEDDHVRQ